jgi:hypothetical protein
MGIFVTTLSDSMLAWVPGRALFRRQEAVFGTAGLTTFFEIRPLEALPLD